ncbi:BrnT family toxin [Candidatus Gottesmanbacteria bacterium]|nr:BrnT family toxin [Candidatus Gottesmanbacteria bacterium]
MKVRGQEIAFEWDEGNLHKSMRKHGVTPEEAESVFIDDNSVVLPDEKHSAVEKRFAIFGTSDVNRYVYVIFTIRKNKLRIISARRMHRKEVEKYDKNKKSAKI